MLLIIRVMACAFAPSGNLVACGLVSNITDKYAIWIFTIFPVLWFLEGLITKSLFIH